MAHYSKTARVSGWGSTFGARRVSGLTSAERQMVRSGLEEVRIATCPPAWTGTGWTTERRVIITGSGRFVTRLPLPEPPDVDDSPHGNEMLCSFDEDSVVPNPRTEDNS